MFDPLHEPSFHLELTGHPTPLEVLAFTGREAISQPFEFLLDPPLDQCQVDLRSLVFRSAWFGIGKAGGGVHGVILDLVPLHDAATPGLWRATLGPKLGCLARRRNQRLFSGLSLPQILKQVLKEHGIGAGARRFELQGDYPALDLCTQYRETDLQFFQRLCQQWGIRYHFEHRREGHCLVLVDRWPEECAPDSLWIDGEAGHANSRFELHADGQGGWAQVRTELADVRAGGHLLVSGYPQAASNGQWLISHIEHVGGRFLPRPYHNCLSVRPWNAPLAPAELLPKPRMSSVQRGWVVSVNGAHRDSRDRVAVQLECLYQGEGGRPSHCWMPLSSRLSEQADAALVVGAQVCVSFIEGDPDRPLISAVFHSSTHSQDNPAAQGEALLQLQISRDAFMGDAPQVDVLGAGPSDQPQFRVGSSEVRFDPTHVHLSSPSIQLQATPGEEPDDDPAQAHGHQDWLRQIQGSQPLTLLCLIPGGGSFSQCRQTVCACRMALGPGVRGAA